MKRKGFTLIELLVTIILLGVIGTIVVLSMTNINNSTKEKDYEKFVAAITSAASVYGSLNPENFQDLYVNKAFIYITTGDLISAGLLDEDLVNPYTNEKIDKDEYIQVDLDAEGALSYTYPAEEDERTDTFLVALSDYVVYGEPYNCMQGAGTYELALSDESGQLIELNNAENIKKYDVHCEMPDTFKQYVENGKSVSKKIGTYSYPYLYTYKPGSYEIKYTWVTDNKVKKSMTRILRVMEKVTPTVNFYDESNALVNTTTAKRDNKKYKFKPEIEGADKTKSSYLMSVNVHTGSGTSGHASETSVKFSDETGFKENWPTSNKGVNMKKITPSGATSGSYYSNWDYTQEVYEGAIDYNIKVKVKGHYYATYEYTSSNSVTFEKDIIIPTSKIHNTDETNANRYQMKKTFNIDNLGTLVPIDHYEYYLATSLSDKPTKNSAAIKMTSVPGSVTLNNINTCANSKIVTYEYVYFRAVNKNGYVGSWSPLTTSNETPTVAKLTNSLNKLASNDKNAYNLGSGSAYGNLSGVQKYFKTPEIYVELLNKNNYNTLKSTGSVNVPKYVVLGTMSSDLLMTGNLTAKTSLVYVTSGSQRAKHCDGSFVVSYNYASAAYGNLKTPISNYPSNFPTLNLTGSNMEPSQYIVNRNWYADFGGTNGYKYTGLVGMPTANQYNIFSKIFNTYTGSNTVWIGNSTSTRHIKGGMDPNMCCHPLHVAYVSYTWTYIYTNKGWASSGNYQMNPMFEMIDMATCAGSGTSSDPYIIVGTR